MVDPDRRPTAQEIEELIDLVRRDPSSPAFIDLGEAYLNLGRPRDAAQVGNLGLEAAPENLEGRVMLARAYAQLHQWKEAQGELLRVVKVDRSNRTGFALLGEVLLRRSDFERAVPVLQHAQNLDPTSPSILAMLKRARSNQTLDAPPPVPTPVPPRGETEDSAQPFSAGMSPAMMQTQVPPGVPRGRGPSAPPPMRGPMMAPGQVPMALPQMPTMAINPPMMPPAPQQRPFVPTGAPDAQTFNPSAQSPARGAPKQTAPPPMSVEGIRPRMISGAKPQNAAAASLRQSAAVGESYLNDLLTGGLLDVAGVRVPDGNYDLRPDRRWGRSTRRAFIFLFVVLVLGIGGGGTWYWWTEKTNSEAIARLQKEAAQAIVFADQVGFRTASDKLTAAVKKDKSNLQTFAVLVETEGLEVLLYGAKPDGVDAALRSIGTSIVINSEEPGARSLLVGKAAVELSRLHLAMKEAEVGISQETLATITKQLDAYLAKHEDDRWVRWLKGRAQLAAGERKDGFATIKRAADGEGGLVIAMIDEADLLVDEGHLDTAIPIYESVLAKSKDHPLAVLGLALGRAENAVDAEQSLNDLNDKFVESKIPRRVAEYRALARTLGNLATEDYAKVTDQLVLATADRPRPKKAGEPDFVWGPGDPRFWARIAWIYYSQGRLNEAEEVNKLVRTWGKKPADDNPITQLLGAGIALSSGNPEHALDLAAKIEGIRSRTVRAKAYIDLGQYGEALKETDEITKVAKDNLEAQVLHEQARMMMNPKNEKERTDAANNLVGFSRKQKTKLPSHALGVAYLSIGDTVNAKEAFTKALTEVSDEAPNPVAYRSETGLAQIALAAGNIPEAAVHVDNALKLNASYFPARAFQTRVVLRNGEADRALALLEPLTKDNGGGTEVQLTLAEALILKKGSTDKDKERAKAILKAIKDKVQPQTEVGRIAALIDPKLPEELGVVMPEPPPPEGGVPKKQPKKPPRRGR